MPANDQRRARLKRSDTRSWCRAMPATGTRGWTGGGAARRGRQRTGNYEYALPRPIRLFMRAQYFRTPLGIRNPSPRSSKPTKISHAPGVKGVMSATIPIMSRRTPRIPLKAQKSLRVLLCCPERWGGEWEEGQRVSLKEQNTQQSAPFGLRRCLQWGQT